MQVLLPVILLLLLGLGGPASADPLADGLAAYNQGHFSTAIKLLSPLAALGNATAQVALGRMYDEGQGVSQDYAEAAHWYRRAAEQGDPFGENDLGVMYMQGRGVRRDYVRAMKWIREAVAQGNRLASWNLDVLLASESDFRQADPEVANSYREAAEKGDPDAQYALGTIYLEGSGVPQDYVRAYMWLNLAATATDFYIYARKRDQAAARLTSAQIAHAQKQAREWRPK